MERKESKEGRKAWRGREGRGKGKVVQAQKTQKICIDQREESEMLELFVHPPLSPGLARWLNKYGCLFS